MMMMAVVVVVMMQENRKEGCEEKKKDIWCKDSFFYGMDLTKPIRHADYSDI